MHTVEQTLTGQVVTVRSDLSVPIAARVMRDDGFSAEIRAEALGHIVGINPTTIDIQGDHLGRWGDDALPGGAQPDASHR